MLTLCAKLEWSLTSLNFWGLFLVKYYLHNAGRMRTPKRSFFKPLKNLRKRNADAAWPHWSGIFGLNEPIVFRRMDRLKLRVSHWQSPGRETRNTRFTAGFSLTMSGRMLKASSASFFLHCRSFFRWQFWDVIVERHIAVSGAETTSWRQSFSCWARRKKEKFVWKM